MAYSVKFQNFSSTTWTRSVSGSSIDVVLQNLNKKPGGHLKAHSGLEELSADQNTMSFVASGDIDLYCCWWNPANSERFGVKLHVPVQVFGIGTGPYWYVMQDVADIGAKPSWQKSASDPATPYTFSVGGFTIDARPTASHSAIDVAVTIQDAK